MEPVLATLIFTVCAILILSLIIQISLVVTTVRLEKAFLELVKAFAKRVPIVFTLIFCMYLGLSYALIHIMYICWPLM